MRERRWSGQAGWDLFLFVWEREGWAGTEARARRGECWRRARDWGALLCSCNAFVSEGRTCDAGGGAGAQRGAQRVCFPRRAGEGEERGWVFFFFLR